MWSNVRVSGPSGGSSNPILPPELWDRISTAVPIACVDILPVRRSADGSLSHIGLILRESPWGEVWCHLGGRVFHGETLAEAARRHLETTLTNIDRAQMATRPFFVNQYFVEARPGAGYGWDPRKHAVATCYVADVPDGVTCSAMGEGLDFAWYELDRLPPSARMWPGADVMLRELLAQEVGHRAGSDADLAVFAAVSDRHNSHNELMWQTPVVAMSAMAFLLTIALGDGRNDTYRAVAGILSAMIALVSLQLMAKHSRSQRNDADLLHSMEQQLHMTLVHAPPAPRTSRMTRLSDGLLGRLERRLEQGRSRRWWMAAMAVLGLVSAGVAIDALRRS